MSLLSLKNIDFSYHHKNGSFALKNISFEIERADFLSILGPNGSGKSTLIKILMGYLKPNQGEVSLNGKEMSHYKPKEIAKIIAYVPQLPSSIYPFNVYEIIAMGRFPHLGISGFEKDGDRKKILEVIELLELEDVLRKGINEISGGETQRAFIARALVQEPEILLLDEPNAHLDIKHQITIFNLLKTLNQQKSLTIITVMHDLNLAKFYCKNTIVLREGKLLLVGETDEVITKENIFSAFDVHVDIQKNDVTNNKTIFINPGYSTDS